MAALSPGLVLLPARHTHLHDHVSELAFTVLPANAPVHAKPLGLPAAVAAYEPSKLESGFGQPPLEVFVPGISCRAWCASVIDMRRSIGIAAEETSVPPQMKETDVSVTVLLVILHPGLRNRWLAEETNRCLGRCWKS